MSSIVKVAICHVLGSAAGLTAYNDMVQAGTEIKSVPRLVSDFEYKNNTYNCGMSINSAADLILFGFTWNDTPQGSDFWNEAHTIALNKDKYPV